MGKTTLAINMGENVALDPNVRGTVLIFSMEMPAEQLMTRMLASVGGVPLHDIRSGRVSDQDWVRITSATSQLQEAKLFIDDQPAGLYSSLQCHAVILSSTQAGDGPQRQAIGSAESLPEYYPQPGSGRIVRT